MAAYALALVLLGAAYASLVFVGQGLALACAIAALAATVVATLLVIFR
jgi:hypothetical protein